MSVYQPCYNCSGRGEVYADTSFDFTRPSYDLVPCPSCFGSGHKSIPDHVDENPNDRIPITEYRRSAKRREREAKKAAVELAVHAVIMAAKEEKNAVRKN